MAENLKCIYESWFLRDNLPNRRYLLIGWLLNYCILYYFINYLEVEMIKTRLYLPFINEYRLN